MVSRRVTTAVAVGRANMNNNDMCSPPPQTLNSIHAPPRERGSCPCAAVCLHSNCAGAATSCWFCPNPQRHRQCTCSSQLTCRWWQPSTVSERRAPAVERSRRCAVQRPDPRSCNCTCTPSGSTLTTSAISTIPAPAIPSAAPSTNPTLAAAAIPVAAATSTWGRRPWSTAHAR